jgi:hypothetical protein
MRLGIPIGMAFMVGFNYMPVLRTKVMLVKSQQITFQYMITECKHVFICNVFFTYFCQPVYKLLHENFEILMQVVLHLLSVT